MYKINGRPISAKQPLFFYQVGNLVAATSSQELSGVFRIENRIQKQSIFEKIDWTPSSKFTHDHHQLVGIKGKLGISSWPIYAGKPNKFLWYFIVKSLPAGKVKVVGIRKNDGAKPKVFCVGATDNMTWGISPSDGTPIEMEPPQPGIWSLTKFIGGQYYGSIVVNILPSDAVSGKSIFCLGVLLNSYV